MQEKLPTYAVEVGLKEAPGLRAVRWVAVRAELQATPRLPPGIRTPRTCSSTRTRCADPQETPGAGRKRRSAAKLEQEIDKGVFTDVQPLWLSSWVLASSLLALAARGKKPPPPLQLRRK
jgi:hypothetical protein